MMGKMRKILTAAGLFSTVFCLFLLMEANVFGEEKPSRNPESEKTAFAVEEELEESKDYSELSGKSLKKEVRIALRRWKKVEDSQAESTAVIFLALFNALEKDTELPPQARSILLEEVRQRLASLSRQISKTLKKNRREAQKAQALAKSKAKANSKSSSSPNGKFQSQNQKDETEIDLYSAVGEESTEPLTEAELEASNQSRRPKSVSASRNSQTRNDSKKKKGKSAQMSQIAGGGNLNAGDGAGVGTHEQAVRESGEKLVDVIQETIQRDSWEENGGQGTIRFWQPNPSLIILQTEENHEKIQDLLDQLRRAGS